MSDAAKSIDLRLVDLFKKSAGAACIGVLLGGLLILSGWVLDYEPWKNPLAFGGKIHSSVSIAFILSAGALACVALFKDRPWLCRIGQLLALGVVAAGALTLVENLSGLDLSLNHIWWQPREDSAGITFPGPMAPGVSACLILTGLATVLFGVQTRRQIYPAQVLALAAALLALVALLGHTCGIQYLCTLAGCIKVPLAASLLFIVLCYAIFFLGTGRGLAQVFAKSTRAGTLVRHSSLVIASLPLLLWAKTEGEKAGLYDQAFGWALFSLCALSLVIAVVAWTVSTVERLESAVVAASAEPEGASASQTGSSRPLSSVKHVCPRCSQEFSYEQTECPIDGVELMRIVKDPLVDTDFGSKYRITSVLGWGATSTVYRAVHKELNKPAAIKLMHSHKVADMKLVRRFKHEARAVSLLSHPNLVAVHDFGFTDTGEPYLIMDYVGGTSLEDILGDIWQKAGRMSVNRSLQICLQICDGLAHAHGKGVIHRDLKPSNVIVIDDPVGGEQVKIVDFGFAKAVVIEESQRLTKSGEVFGSPGYMSPEQCMGKPIDGRTDVYSLGCILYECLTGQHAFSGENPFDIIRKHVFEDPPVFPDDSSVPVKLQEEVSRMLDKDPAGRHASMAELRAALAQFVSAEREMPVQ